VEFGVLGGGPGVGLALDELSEIDEEGITRWSGLVACLIWWRVFVS
jgi:hypothetical protein